VLCHEARIYGQDAHGFAVADGILTAWRTRKSWHADEEAPDPLAADVASLVARRGL
jgi:hypothetical protein